MEKNFNITNTDFNFETVYNKDYIPQKYLEEIKNANVLILPCEGFRGKEGYYFPECTSELYNCLKNQKDLVAEICIDDDEYNKYELHADLLLIGIIMVKYVVLPVLTSVLASFIYDKIKSMNKRPKDTEIDVHIIVDNDGETKSIDYKGSAEEFKETIDTIQDTIFK